MDKSMKNALASIDEKKSAKIHVLGGKGTPAEQPDSST
jgi:hypothetical protein